eukprot:jgi/Botrbrau1/1385/Bobra.0063s0085.1
MELHHAQQERQQGPYRRPKSTSTLFWRGMHGLVSLCWTLYNLHALKSALM